MNICVYDCKKNEVIKVKIELNELIFLVVPEIIDHKFDYMNYRLMNIRKKYLDLYLQEDCKNENKYKLYEKLIYNDMREILIKEMIRIHREEGIMYYTN